MKNKKMFLNDNFSIKKENKIYNQEKKEKNQPLLQIFFKNNKKEKNAKILNKKSSIPQTPKPTKFNSSFNFNFQKNESEKDLKEKKNVTPIKKIKNNKYIFNNGKFKNDNDLISYIKNDKKNDKQNKNKFNNSHLYESRNLNKNKNNRNTVSISLNNNSLFPSINGKASLFKITKKGTPLDNNLEDKNRQNNYAYNNINLQNFNSNSILVTEARPKKFSFFQKYLGDKYSFQKSVNFNNANSLKNLSSEDSDLKKINNIRFNTEISDKIINDKIYMSEKTNKNNLSSNFNYNLMHEKNEINKKINKAKSFKFNNLRNINYYNKKPILTEDYPEIKKKKNVISFIPRNDNKDLKLSIIQAFSHEKSLDLSNNKNKKRIFFMKNQNQSVEENNKNINCNIKPISIPIINNDNLKTINYLNNKEIIINNLQDRVLSSNINKSIDKNYISNSIINNGNDNSDSSKKIIIFPKRKSNYLNKENNNKCIIFKDEEKYITNKKLKIIEKLKKNRKLNKLYTPTKKNYFLEKEVIKSINNNLLGNDLLLKLKEEEKKLIKMKKYLIEIFHYILNKPNDYHPYENIDKLGLYFFNDEPIDLKLKIHFNYDIFDMYKEYIKFFEDKWKNNNDIKYKNLIEFFSFNYILNDKKNKNKSSFFEIEDRRFFSYKERIIKDFRLYFKTINFINTNKIKESDESNQKINKTIKAKYSMKKLKRIPYARSKTLNLSIQRNNKPEYIKSFNFNHNNSIETVKKKEKKTSFSKIQEELSIEGKINNIKRNTKINRILPKKTKKKVNFADFLNNNKIENKNKEKEKEIAFNYASKKVENYNILKNYELFKKNFNDQNDLDEEEKFKNLISRRLTINYLREFPEDISEIIRGAIELEEDSPDVKLFKEFIDILEKKEIDKFYNLIKNNEDNFKKIINKQEKSTGNTLLIYATKNNLKSIVEFLLIQGANTEIKNIYGKTALQIAYQDDNTFMINLFEEYHRNKK